MTLHGNILDSGESAQLAAIRDRHEADRGRVRAEFPQWKTIGTLLAWHDRLASLLAEREAEIDRLRASLKSADDAMREAGSRVGIDMGDDTAHWMANEIDRLRAELLATPPTLDWLLSRLGHSSVTKWHGVHDIHEWSCGVKWYRGQLRCVGPTGMTLMTRGCVEKVLAAMKEAAK